jgi:hypothetical protein
MLELVTTLTTMTASEADVIATVTYLVNAGLVELTGNFRDSRLAFDGVPARQAA